MDAISDTGESLVLVRSLMNPNALNTTNATSNTASGLAYIEKCPFVYNRRTVLPLTNKF